MLDVVAQVAGWTVLAGAVGQAGLGLYSSLRRRALERVHDDERLASFRERSQAQLAIVNAERDRAERSWNGIRKFVVERIVDEAADIKSFHLAPHDGKPLPSFLPGQYLTFQLHVPNQPRPVIRCYSLSDAPGDPARYRVTIKRVPAGPGPDQPPGLASNYFHQQVRQGDILDVQAPSGKFVFDALSDRPAVLIGGGIGITPMLSMLNALVARGTRRDIHFFYGVRNKSEHVMAEHLRQVAAENDNVSLRVVYSAPSESCVAGADYTHLGFVSVDLLRAELPSNECDFYLCGPPGMMASLAEGLPQWGVPTARIHSEAFGPAALAPAKKPTAEAGSAPQADTATVVFARSGKECQWSDTDGSLLDLASKHGVFVESGCRAGSCGTCLTAIKEGKVRYLQEPGRQPEDGSCLACIAVPDGPLVIDV